MVTYAEVKNKLVTTRTKILKEMSVNRILRAKQIYDAVRDKIKYINDELLNAINVNALMTIDRHILELYTNQATNEVGEKKISFDYNDVTEYINGRELVPFSVFDYDTSLYENGVSNIANEMNKHSVIVRTDAVGVGGDWEDAIYSYFKPSYFYEGYEFSREFELLYGDWPSFIPSFEFLLYGMEADKYYVGKIEGIAWYFYFPNDVTVIVSDSGVAYINSEKNSLTWKASAYRMLVEINNQSSYDVDVIYKNQIFKCGAGKYTYYIHFIDTHLTQTPIKLFETTY